jgi:hypothetical protein
VSDIVVPRGQVIGGNTVGIIVIDACYPMIPGNVANATSFRFPVRYEILSGVTPAEIMRADPGLESRVIEAGLALVRQGARAVCGACGSFANFQRAVADAIGVPTFLSVLLQIPMLLGSLPASQKVGVIASSKAALNDSVLAQSGITDRHRIAVAELAPLDEFQRMVRAEGALDVARLEREVLDLVEEFCARDPSIGALLLQCSDLPPFAAALQSAVRKPIVDMTSLINWAWQTTHRTPFVGVL